MKVLLHPGADDDYLECHCWYRRKSARLATKFEHAFAEVLARIAADPLGGTAYDEGHRFYRIAAFPHLVIYHCDESRAEIVAISHPSRDQSFWQSR